VLSSLTHAAPHEPGFLTDREVRDEMLTLLIAGHETTANALSWAFERLLRHPAALEQPVSGLDSGSGEDYLDAVVRETLRQRPILPVTARRLTRSVTLGEFTFPRGWTLMPCIYLIHRDPDAFPDPDRFLPERFLGDSKPSSRVWVPFGAGSRHCIGSHLAMLTIKSVLRTVLSRVRLEADSEPEAIVRNNMTLAPGRGARAVLVGARGVGMPRRSSAPA